MDQIAVNIYSMTVYLKGQSWPIYRLTAIPRKFIYADDIALGGKLTNSLQPWG